MQFLLPSYVFLRLPMKIKTRTKNCLFFSFLSLLRNKLYIKDSSAISYMEVQIVLVWRALPVFRLTHFSTDPYNYTTQLFYIHSTVFQLFLEDSKVLMKVNSSLITVIELVHMVWWQKMNCYLHCTAKFSDYNL